MKGRRDSLSLFLREGRVVLSDGVQQPLESRGNNYADGRNHMVRFSKLENGIMHLVVDGVDEVNGSAPERQDIQRRQNSGPPMIAPVLVYLGGGENLAMFNGCIKFPFLTKVGRPMGLLTAGIKCGTSGTVCGGRVLFNKCEVSQSNSALLSMLDAPSAKRGSRRGRGGRHRADPGRSPSPIVVSVDVLRERYPYDGGCDLPFRPNTNGLRYVGNGYSKYFVKRFNPRNWRFSLSLKTKSKNGLIFFMSDTACREHIAVYLIKGKIAFSVMFGLERTRFKSSDRVFDGNWHHITFERKGNSTQLMVNGSIAGQETINSESFTFPSHIPFYVGGLHIVPKSYASNRINGKNLVDFQGCIRDVTLNNRVLDNDGPQLKVNVSRCYLHGTEPGMFFPYQEGDSSSAYLVVMNSFDVAISMEVKVDIKPRFQSGIIFAVAGTTGDFFNLALVEGKIAARLKQGDETLFTRYDPDLFDRSLCDGKWHSIRVNKAKNMIALTVDDHLVTPIEEGAVANKRCRTNSALYVGGVPDGSSLTGLLTNSQYVGCMRRMSIDFFPVNLTTVISSHGEITSDTCPV